MVLELKKSLVFNECKKAAEDFIKTYSDQENITWKYLYKANVLLAKLF
jgi:hypothetical protein